MSGQPCLVRCAGKPAVESGPGSRPSCSSSGSWLAPPHPQAAAQQPQGQQIAVVGSGTAGAALTPSISAKCAKGFWSFQKRIVVLLPVATKLKLRSAQA